MNAGARVLWANAVGVGLAMVATVWLGASLVDPPSPRVTLASPPSREHVRDFSGHAVPRGDYRRILSSSLFTDRILVELVSPDRVVAFSEESRRHPRLAPLLDRIARANAFGPVEALLSLHPDLVLLPDHSTPSRAQQLREAGVTLFELGQLHGLATFRATIAAVGDLLSVPDAAAAYLRMIDARVAKVQAIRGPIHPPRGIFLSVMGSGLQGGTSGTSFHDVLAIAGIEDMAAGQYSGWPTYSAEAVLAMGPDLIVTREGMGRQVCRFPGMEHAPACGKNGRIVEVPGYLLDDAGASIVDAAEAVATAIYPQPPPSPTK